MDAATRRRLTRWGRAGVALLVLAVAAQALESAVFSPITTTDDPGEIVISGGPAQMEVADIPAPMPDDDSSRLDADCRPERGATPRVRQVDAKVTRAVNRQWRRIEKWLKANAPDSYRTLGAPATPKAIAEAEAAMGLRFPDDLRASLLRHNGAAGSKGTWGFGFLGNWSLSLKEITETWRMLCDIESEDLVADSHDPRSEWWDGRMVPVGSDGMGDHLVIDSVERDVGETDHEGSMSFTPGETRIRSYHALLKATANALESGGSIGFWQPKVVDGELDWGVT